jgi:hypothetical protein
MPTWLRMTLFVLAVAALTVATSVYVFRRGATVLGLGLRGRRALAGVLIAAPLAIVAARLLEPLIPAELSFLLGAAGQTVILGVLISTVLLWVVDLPFGGIRLLRRWRAGEPDAAPVRALSARSTGPVHELALTGNIEGAATFDGMLALGKEAEPSDAAPSSAPSSAVQTTRELAHDTEGELLGPHQLGRRELVRRAATGAALSVGFGSAFYGALFGRHDYEVVEVAIPIAGLSPRLDGYRIVQISDIHFGVYVGDAELRSALEMARRARPDVIVLTGDLLDHDVAYAPWLGRLVRGLGEIGARDGVVVIPGNHDYYAGVEEVLSTASRAGARVLRNTGVTIGDARDRFGLVGVDDVWARRNGYSHGPDLTRALADVRDDMPAVLLCHNPVFFEDARGKVALQLSGHTHGGQVNLGVHPAELVLPYVEGLYVENGSRLWVNRGFGTAGPPARVGAPPEVTLVVLNAA